jgi:hypothetical protein
MSLSHGIASGIVHSRTLVCVVFRIPFVIIINDVVKLVCSIKLATVSAAVVATLAGCKFNRWPTTTALALNFLAVLIWVNYAHLKATTIATLTILSSEDSGILTDCATSTPPSPLNTASYISVVDPSPFKLVSTSYPTLAAGTALIAAAFNSPAIIPGQFDHTELK